MITVAEPSILLPGAGTTCTLSRRLPISPPLRSSWLSEWTVSEASGICRSTRCNEGLLKWYMKVATFSTSPQPFCSRSNCALGFVNQHRVQSLMTGLCRTANSCKAGLIMGALRIACNGLCTAARFHSAEENHGWLLWCSEGPDCLQHYNRCPPLFNYSRSLQPGTSERISPMAIFSDFLLKNGCPK